MSRVSKGWKNVSKQFSISRTKMAHASWFGEISWKKHLSGFKYKLNKIRYVCRVNGWEADTKILRYSNGTRPQKNKNLAIAEWPTDSIGSRKSGRADYALFVGLELVALIEAKRGSKDISADIEDCKEYAKKIKEEHKEYIINTWGEYKVPFLFATNGRKYLKQLEEKSGIWFLDSRNSTNHPKALQSWYTPRGLKELLDKDIELSTKSLEEETFEYLTDPKGLNLRKYQINAIKAIEDAIADGKENILISMATGERVIIVMGAINVLKSRVSGTFTEKFLCIAYSN